MSSGKSAFFSLPLIHQRALHELWLNRSDPNFVVSEETKEFLLQNQSILREEFRLDFEQEPFSRSTYSQFTDPSGTELLLFKERPSTPNQSDSEDDIASLQTEKIQQSNKRSSESISSEEIEEDVINRHQSRSNVTTLHKSPRDSYPSHYSPKDMSQQDDFQENNNDEDGEVTIQYGLNGKPIDYKSPSSKVFVNLKPPIRLDGSMQIDHQLVTKFVAQIKNDDSEIQIEKLVDKVSWRSILRIARGRCQDTNSVPQRNRSYQLEDLEKYLFRKDDEYVALDETVWNNKTICHLLLDCYPESISAPNLSEHFSTRMVAIKPQFDLAQPTVELEFARKVDLLQSELAEDTIITSSQVTFIITSWVKMWPSEVQARWKLFIVNRESNSSISIFLDNFISWLIDARNTKNTCEHVGYIVSPGPHSSWYGTKKNEENTNSSNNKNNNQPGGSNKDHKRKQQPLSTDTPPTDQKSTCDVCNRLLHPNNKCPFYSWHPFANKEKKAFSDSLKGKEYIEGHAKKFRYLDTRDLSGDVLLTNVPKDFKNPPAPHFASTKQPGSSGSSSSSNSKGTHLVAFSLNTPTFLATLIPGLNDHLITCTISLIQAEVATKREGRTVKGPDVSVEALLDSGSLAGNFISPNTYRNLGGSNTISVDRPDSSPVCSGLNNDCTYVSNIVHKLSISLITENINNTDFLSSLFSFFADVRILSNTPFDLIIGLETIKEFNLPLVLPSHFFNSDSIGEIQRATYPLSPGAKLLHGLVSGEKDDRRQTPFRAQPCLGCGERSCGSFTDSALQPGLELTPNRDVRVETVSRTHDGRPEGEQLDSDEGCYPLPLLAPAQTHDNLITSLVRETQDLFAAHHHTDDEIDYDKVDSFSPFLVVDEIVPCNDYFPGQPLLSAIHLEGDPELISGLVILLKKYAHIFRNDLPKDPADIPPFDLVVDMEKWRNPKNRGPPRVQSSANQAETVKQIDQLLAQNIIERSDASYYSQVLLTTKADGKKRFCIDYRKLNDCTKPASWPLLNIKQMFVRLGTHKSSIYGVLDLTSGYHQAPLSLAARIFTAFITFCGVFHYLRLPFGPKRAPSYFQEMMAAVVLAGLVYFICEIYLDDCIIHAADNASFLARLETVLQRFSKHKLFLKPAKCRFGAPKVEFCGRVISKLGISMSEKKISQVLNFPFPIYHKQLKSFLGLVGYFRPHIRDLSKEAHPLNEMLINYNRTTLLKWDDITKTSFRTLVDLVSDCSTMYFVDPDLPLYLHTDASDYGIGGYLFQIIDSVERPCAFISKSLVDSQLRWSTIQKEAYSIYYCCKELDYLLRDRPFILRTDHDNLRFIHDSSNQMIIRWFMALMELEFILEHIAGVKNIIADALSRLCANYMQDLPREFSKEDIYVSTLFPDFKIPEDKYLLIAHVHNSLAGHHGVERTIKKLLDSHQSWPYLRQHVKKFVSLCPLCQKISAIKLKIHASPFVTSRYTPMECINIDYVGPYPDGGYVIVIIDTFTRWIELMAVDAATGAATAWCLLQHFGRFGAPTQVRSDRGSHFVNSVIREFLMLIGTEHCLTLSYSKEENALVERANKEVNRHLRAFTFDTNTVDNWRLSLPMVQRIMNATFSDRTKLSSSQILFGNALNLDRGIFTPPTEIARNTQPLSDYMIKLLAIQDNIMTIARNNIIFTDSMHLGTYPAPRTDHAPGSFVLVKYREGAPPSRLHTLLKGPLRVIKGSQSIFTLLDLVTNKEKDYHVSDLKPFRFDPLNTNPLEVARKDYLEFFIEAILKHSGTRQTKKSNLRFYIKWLGYDDDHNSWEPYSNIRDMTVCHEYLRSHGMSNHIPKKFTA
jgi:transposase InsO family protein